MYQQYNYTFHELRMQLENQVVQIQIQYHKAFQIIWETVVMIGGVSYQYQKPLTIYLQTKSFTINIIESVIKERKYQYQYPLSCGKIKKNLL